MRLIDADEIVKVAERSYDAWNLAMATADGNRQINLTYKRQDLCKAVRAVAEAAPTIDPESLRPQGEWEDEYGGEYENSRYRSSVCKEKALFKIDRDCLGGWHEVQALTPSCPQLRCEDDTSSVCFADTFPRGEGFVRRERSGRNMKQIVVFDFDGVIHSYESGWRGADIIPDPPVPGIREAIAEIRAAGYEVAVVSTRCATREGMLAVAEWLEANDIRVNKVCKEKPPAIVYIDDRAICFDGHPEVLLGKIKAFEPWNKTKRK